MTTKTRQEAGSPLYARNTGQLVTTPNGVKAGMWVCPRPMTKGWGSGQVWNRIVEHFGLPDAAFGVRDGIPDGPVLVDRNTGFEWASLPFDDNQFSFGYWDPPYDRLYKQEGQEIWRTTQRLAVLHEFVYPTSWFKGAKREAGVAITMGPLRRVRLLQIFRKVGLNGF